MSENDLLRIETSISPATAEELRRSPEARPILARMLKAQARRRWPRPGAAARQMAAEIEDSIGDRIRLTLPAMREGTSIRIAHLGPGDISLHGGNTIMTAAVELPETIMIAATNRRLADVVDLPDGAIGTLAEARITGIFTLHGGEWMVINTDAPTTMITLDEVGSKQQP